MEKENLIILTGDIASAYVANNEIGFESVGRLVTDIHGALASLGQQVNEVEPAEPVVSVRASLKNEHLVCLACGRKMKTLKRHLANEHGMTPPRNTEMHTSYLLIILLSLLLMPRREVSMPRRLA